MKTRFLFSTIIAFFLITIHVQSQVTPGDTIHAAKYVIELEEVDISAHTITANTNVTVVPLVNNLPFIQLELMDLTVDSVFVNMLKTSDYTHTNEVITIQLESPISMGDTTDVLVYYHGEPFHESWGGFHFAGNYAFNLGVGISWIPHNLGKAWFPCIDDFTDRASYEVKATVPETLKAVGGGDLIEYTENGDGTHTFRYYIANPIPTYLVSISIGEYAVVEDTYPGLERDIPITYWVHPSDTLQVAGTFARMHEVMDLFEDRFGPYDWSRVGYITTSNYGAMEHAANIAIPNYFINGNLSYESTIIHELSHMWFGDKVTCDKAEEMWINEGWATFSQYYYTEVLDGASGFKIDMRNMHNNVLLTCHKVENGFHPMNNIPQQYTYGLSAYDRGATKVQALRAYLGETAFFPACQDYVEDFAFTSVSSYDMEANFSQNTGIDMSGFFNNWIYNGGTPHYSIDSFNVEPNGGNWDVSIHVKQKRHGPAFVGDGNVIGFSLLAQDLQQFDGTVDFDGETGSTTVTVPFHPVEVFLDLQERYMDATIDNYKVIAEPGSYSFPKTLYKMDVEQIIDSVFIQATHNFVAPDTFEIPVPGLTLSDNHYWTVRGVLAEDLVATGSFNYSFMGFDNSLITGPYDSLVILYRKDAGMIWEQVEFIVDGSWANGHLVVQDLRMGDYVFGVWADWVSTEENTLKSLDESFKVFPNPSSGKFNFGIMNSDAFQIDIYALNGELMESLKVADHQEQMSWNPEEIAGGSYFAVLRNRSGKVIESRKLLYNK